MLAFTTPGWALPRIDYKLVAGMQRGTTTTIGRDIAKWVADPADIRLDVLASAGSAENIRRLLYEPGVKFALVHADVYQALLDRAAAGNEDAHRLVRPLRVATPVYREELHFVVRADSPLSFISEIKDRKIALGGGSALTAHTIYRLLFGEELPDGNAVELSNEDALIQLIAERTVDVALIVAGQPAKLFADMKPEARNYIKLLRADGNAIEKAGANNAYEPAAVMAASYPAWLAEDIPTLAVESLLMTYDFEDVRTRTYLTRFAQALCLNLANLRAQGHPKWKEFELKPRARRGWQYYAPIEQELRACLTRKPAAAARRTSLPADALKPCTSQEKALALCKE